MHHSVWLPYLLDALLHILTILLMLDLHQDCQGYILYVHIFKELLVYMGGSHLVYVWQGWLMCWNWHVIKLVRRIGLKKVLPWA